MRLLFEIDKKDYEEGGEAFIRPSARAIIFKDGILAAIYSNKKKYYKIPGGGIEDGETPINAIIREVKEEVGLEVIRDSIKEFGYVHRIQKGKNEPIFIQDNYYYFCDVYEGKIPLNFSENEKEEEFEPVFVSIEDAIKMNEQYVIENPQDSGAERELRVMKMIQEESFFMKIL